MSGHTPGPWEWTGSPNPHILVSRAPELSDGGDVSEKNVIFFLTTAARRRLSYHENDARLIAAAPDLLAALKSIEWVAIGTGARFCADCGGYRSDGHSKHCKLAAAIAKAEGR